MELNEIVREIRKELDISQEDFARELHVGFASVSRWENARAKPNKMARHIIVEYCKQKNVRKELIEAFQKAK